MAKAKSGQTNRQFTYGYYVVCILDILGQKQRLDAWPKSMPDSSPTPELIDALKKSAGTVIQLRKYFEDYYTSFEIRKTFGERFSRLSSEERSIYLRAMDSTLKTKYFSDTFLFYAPLGNAHGDETVGPLFQMLTACASMHMTALTCNVALRGGIAIGLGIDMGDDGFYGPALAEAHRLESKCAGYPRIVVSDEVVRFSAKTNGFSPIPLIDQVNGAHNRNNLAMTCKDTDGQNMVDFLGERIRELGKTDETVDAVKKAYIFASTERMHFQQLNDEKHVNRYNYLLNYMQSRLSNWGLADLQSSIG